MKKGIKTNTKQRLVVYLDKDMEDWVNKKAEDIQVSPGYIIRRMIHCEMKVKK